MLQKSAPFQAFADAQTRINKFFWSTELSYEIVQQRVLADIKGQDRRESVYTYFHLRHGVRANTFAMTHKQRTRRQAGEPVTNPGHYWGTIDAFEKDLKKHLEHVCLYVLVHCHTMLETFLRNRFGEIGFTPAQCKSLWSSYPSLPNRLRQEGITLHARNMLTPEVLWRAEIYRTLRNIVTHEMIDLHTRPWSDTALLKKLRQNKNCPETYILAVCGQSVRSARRFGGLPLLFFYALYCLTDYRRFALAVDRALPPVRSMPA